MPGSPSSSTLHGLRIIVTRPAHQAESFCALLERAGAEPLRCPVIRISSPADGSELQRLAARLGNIDLLIFNSPNAVEYGIAAIHGLRQRIPPQTLIGAIGTKTAQALERHGYRADVCPATGFDSEAFLALPAVQAMQGKRVAIVRGQDGRMLLGRTLRARGAEVVYVQAYQRNGPDAEQAAALRQALRDGVDAVAVTSSEALENLTNSLDAPARAGLERATLLVGHPRIAEAARRLGLPPPVVAADPTDEAMYAALADWAARHRTDIHQSR